MAAPATPGVAVLTLLEARALVSDLTSGQTGQLADNVVVQRYIDAATRVVEGIAGPIVVQQLSWSWDGGTSALPLPWPILSQYDMTLTENGVALTNGADYRVDTSNAMLLGGQPPQGFRWFAAGLANVKLTAWAGRETVPAALKSAVAEEFRFLWQQGQQQTRAQWGSDGAAPDYAPAGYAVPHRVIELAQFEQHLPGFA